LEIGNFRLRILDCGLRNYEAKSIGPRAERKGQGAERKGQRAERKGQGASGWGIGGSERGWLKLIGSLST